MAPFAILNLMNIICKQQYIFYQIVAIRFKFVFVTKRLLLNISLMQNIINDYFFYFGLFQVSCKQITFVCK